MARAAPLLCCLVLLAAGCGWEPDTSPSSGVCQGKLGTRTVTGTIDFSASEYHREGNSFVAKLSYVRGTLEAAGRVPAEFTPSPSEFVLAESDSGAEWSLQSPAERPALESGAVKVDQTTPYRMQGSLQVSAVDGSVVACTFDLRRAIELEEPVE